MGFSAGSQALTVLKSQATGLYVQIQRPLAGAHFCTVDTRPGLNASPGRENTHLWAPSMSRAACTMRSQETTTAF